jgi:hypothetical protein
VVSFDFCALATIRVSYWIYWRTRHDSNVCSEGNAQAWTVYAEKRIAETCNPLHRANASSGSCNTSGQAANFGDAKDACGS